MPREARDQCRLMLFAFCGRRDLAERLLFGGSLASLPAATRAYWLATADLAAGASASGRRQLDLLLPAADPPTRQAIERRLARPLTPAASLDASAQSVIESAALEHGHEESFGAQPSLFSKQGRATQILIGLNVLMFGWRFAWAAAIIRRCYIAWARCFLRPFARGNGGGCWRRCFCILERFISP